jgi:general secretion pathway protein F
MATFNYTALDNLGKKKKGVLSAQSEREARKFIKNLNLTPITVGEISYTKGITSKVKNKDLVVMTRQIATLLEARLYK